MVQVLNKTSCFRCRFVEERTGEPLTWFETCHLSSHKSKLLKSQLVISFSKKITRRPKIADERINWPFTCSNRPPTWNGWVLRHEGERKSTCTSGFRERLISPRVNGARKTWLHLHWPKRPTANAHIAIFFNSVDYFHYFLSQIIRIHRNLINLWIFWKFP